MFVLKNAWSSIVRRKWRTLLTMFIAIIVTFGTLFGFSVLHADESATDGYNPQLVSAVIRPDAKTKATYNAPILPIRRTTWRSTHTTTTRLRCRPPA